MPTYRRSKKVSSVAKSEEKTEPHAGGENRRHGDRIAPAQWKQENSTRCQSASLARMVSERLRSESVWLMKEVGQATAASQRDSNFRLEEKLRDTSNWRGELQAELDSLAGETELLIETRYQLQSSIEQTQRPLRVTTACLIAREGRRAGDRVRDQVEVSLEKEVDVMRSQQMKMRDLLVQVQTLKYSIDIPLLQSQGYRFPSLTTRVPFPQTMSFYCRSTNNLYKTKSSRPS